MHYSAARYIVAAARASWRKPAIRSLISPPGTSRKSDVVEVSRVGLEDFVDRGLGQRRELLARFLHRAQESLGVRVVRADEEAVVAGELHDVGEHPLVGIGADPDVAMEVLLGRALHLGSVAHVLVAIVDPLDPFAHPS